MSEIQYTESAASSRVQQVAVKYRVHEENAFTLINRAQNGLPVSAFHDLIGISGLSNEELAGLLDLSYKTIQRYQKDGKKLSALNSEQLLKMIVLWQKAEEVFGDLASFTRWLRKPAVGLGNRVPMPFLQTSGGIDLIREELLRIEHGALA
ncbi:MAG: antitoxin Xre/MbcA/ParS toxin-binding domain-containing protein [Balneolaceae bacterium]